MNDLIIAAIVVGLVVIVVLLLYGAESENSKDFIQIKRREKAMEIISKWTDKE